MAFFVNDSVFFDMYLNGKQMPVTCGNVSNLNITENIYNILPAMRLVILDDKNLFKSGLSAGSKISIKVGKDKETAAQNSYDFIVQGVPEVYDSQSLKVYTIYGILDKLKFQKCTDPFFKTGTSGQALNALCKKCDLKYDGVFTFDEMTWCNGTKDYGSFAANIVAHGYVSSKSLMASVVTLDGRFLYRNVNDLSPKYTFSNNKTLSKSFVFVQMNLKDNSGLYNLEYGYQNQLCQFGLENDNIFDSLSVSKTTSSVFNLSKTILDDVGQVRNVILEPNIGNFHKNWAKAEYQNIRQKALFSLEADFLFKANLNLDLLQKVNLTYIDPQTNQTAMNKPSQFLLIGKTLSINNGNYFERYTGVSTGLDSDFTGRLI